MEDAVEAQLLTQRAIERALVNLNKLGKAKLTRSTLTTRMAHLRANWARFEAGHARLSASTLADAKAAHPYFKEDPFAATEEVYLDSLASMQEKLDVLPSDSVSKPENLSDGQASPTTVAPHLPRIHLPEFDGRYEAWEAFRDRFTALIIANKSLANVTRLHYLVSSLKGRALECVGNLPVTADNFDIAWTTLTARYENPRRLISSHLSSMLDLPALSRESASELQNLRDRVSAIVASLKNLGREPADLLNDVLVHVVSQKLDAPTRKAWKIKTSDDVDPPSFEELTKFIDSRVRA